MSGTGELSLVSVVALVLGGIGAMILAIAVATRDAEGERSGAAPSARAVVTVAPPAVIAPEPPPSASPETEYQLDTEPPGERAP
jgi:hypothetical protein